MKRQKTESTGDHASLESAGFDAIMRQAKAKELIVAAALRVEEGALELLDANVPAEREKRQHSAWLSVPVPLVRDLVAAVRAYNQAAADLLAAQRALDERARTR